MIEYVTVPVRMNESYIMAMKNPNLSREASATRTRDFESEPGVLATRALEFLEPSRDRKGADVLKMYRAATARERTS